MYPDKDFIVHFLYVISRAAQQDGSKIMFMPFEIFSICTALVLFQKLVILQLIHFYINNTCEGFYVTDECLRAVFLFTYSTQNLDEHGLGSRPIGTMMSSDLSHYYFQLCL